MASKRYLVLLSQEIPSPLKGIRGVHGLHGGEHFFVTLLCLQVDLIKRFQECTQIRLTHLAI